MAAQRRTAAIKAALKTNLNCTDLPPPLQPYMAGDALAAIAVACHTWPASDITCLQASARSEALRRCTAGFVMKQDETTMAGSYQFDLAVIGAGPGGYIAAIRAAQLGMRVACIEKEPKLGGTCLRVGCIPSKTLLEASEKFTTARHHFASIGIKCPQVELDLPTMMSRKDKVVDTLSSGIAGLFKKNKIERISGTASFKSPHELTIASGGQSSTITCGKALIATGSVPIEIPSLKFNGKTIISSDQAIALAKVPERLVVVGAGAIGLELGSVWARLGSKVTVLELLPNVLPGMDEEMSRQMERALKAQGLEIHLGVQAGGVTEKAGKVEISFAPKADPKAQTILPCDVVLVAVGRRPYTTGLGLEKIGVTPDPRGFIAVNAHWQTSVPDVYAIGDVTPGPMLAHKAEDEGVAVAEHIAGKAGHVNYNTIPAVVYTHPELAAVGKTEEQLKTQGVNYKAGKFRFAANSRAMCMDDTTGLVKVLADAKTDRVLGVHIFGPQASSLIAEAVIAMELGASSEDIARTCHAHPTLPEALREAALAVDGRMLNS